MSAAAETLPAPLVRPAKHPITWTRQRLALLGLRAVFTYVGICAMAALYYILFETKVHLPGLGETNTQAWHRAIPDSTLRHDIRNVGEGLFGGLLAIAVTYNHYRRLGRPRNAVDRVEIALGIPNLKDERKLTWWQIPYGILLIPVYAAVGFVVGEWLVGVIHPAVSHVAELKTGSFLTNVKSNFLEHWPQKLIGLLAAFCFGHRPALAVIDDVQLWFAERRVALSKGARPYDTPPFKARCNELLSSGGIQARAGEGHLLRRALVLLGVAVLALGAYGYYVLNYIAK